MRSLAPRSVRFIPLVAALLAVGAVRGVGPADAGPDLRVFVSEGKAPGPTVMIVGGVHGNEWAGALAAGQIRHWPLGRGRLVILPRANVKALAARKRYTPGVTKQHRNLNRNYPTSADDAPRGEIASAIWKIVEREKPDWLLDLHEGFSVHKVNKKSSGHSVICHPDQEDVQAVADRMIAAVNKTVGDPERHFVRLRMITRSMLARSAADHLGARTMILETCYGTGPLSRRTRRHRVMVRVVLRHLEMLEDGVGIDTVLPTERDAGEELRVAVYDAEGTGGPGVPRALAQIGGERKTTVVRVCPEDIRAGVLDAFDVVTFTGGGGSTQARALGTKGRARVRAFVEGGGGYVGVCAGAYLALSGFSWSLSILDGKTVSPKWRRGRGTVEMELTRAGRRVMHRPTRRVEVRYHNGPILEPFGSDDLPDYEVWAAFRTEIAKNGTPKGVMVDSPAIAVGQFGEGRVVVISPHPEQTKGLEMILPRATRWAAEGDA